MAAGQDCSLVLLAHHRRDQAETWLLQALRGAGAAGLAAMPEQALRAGMVWARPWLDQPREAIEAYVQRHRLAHVDDASNADPCYARNRLRLQVWPALTAAFADAEVALAGASRQAAHADALAREVAEADLPAVVDGAALRVAPWLALPPARRRNALQAWLRSALPGPVSHSLVRRLLEELPGAAGGQWPAQGVDLRLHRGRLRAVADAGAGGCCGAGRLGPCCRVGVEVDVGVIVIGHRLDPCARLRGSAGLAGPSACRGHHAGRRATGAAGHIARPCACGRGAIPPGRHRPAARPEEAVPVRGRAGLGNARDRCCTCPTAACSSCPAWASTLRCRRRPACRRCHCPGIPGRQGGVRPTVKMRGFPRAPAPGAAPVPQARSPQRRPAWAATDRWP